MAVLRLVQAKKSGNKGGTLTSEGLISHISWRGISLPVYVSVPRSYSRLSRLPIPIRENRVLIYALPGGDTISAVEVRRDR